MPSMASFAIVALGGALGSAFRYLAGTQSQAASRYIDLPDGTRLGKSPGGFTILNDIVNRVRKVSA